MTAPSIVFDDPVTPSRDYDLVALREVTEWFGAAFTIARAGSYRNRFGELVTWGSSEDGRYVVVQTWL